MIKLLKAISWLFWGLTIYGVLHNDYAQATFDLLLLIVVQHDIAKMEAKAKKRERVG